jgi:hypothetical protein
MNRSMIMMAAAVAMFATGCIVVHKNDGGESNLRPCIVKDKVHEIYEASNQTVSATEQIQCVLNFICWGATASHIADQAEFSGFGAVAKAKNGAYAKACEAAKCDHLVGTRYTITKEDYIVYAKYNVEVTGYPVKIKGVETLPPCGVCPCPKK